MTSLPPIHHTTARVVFLSYKSAHLAPTQSVQRFPAALRIKSHPPGHGLYMLVRPGPCFPPQHLLPHPPSCSAWTMLASVQSPNPLSTFCLRIFAQAAPSAWNAPLLPSLLQPKQPKGESPIKEQPPQRCSPPPPQGFPSSLLQSPGSPVLQVGYFLALTARGSDVKNLKS